MAEPTSSILNLKVGTIRSFQGEYRFLSNFYEAEITYDGSIYRNTESAFQAAKLIDDNYHHRHKYFNTTGSEAKALSKELKQFTRRGWITDSISIRVMSEITHLKYLIHKDIREKLVLTYPNILIEGNTWHDDFWGVCTPVGLNWLGRILMAERVYWLEMIKNGMKG